VEGRSLAVDGTLVGANASEQSRVPREQLARTARVSLTVQEYLTELEQQNPVADPDEHPIAQQMVSTTDPDAFLTVKRGPATLGYYDNYLVDTTSRAILSVDATPARFRQEVLAAQTNDRAREPVRHSSTESGGRQGLRKRRVSGVTPREEYSTSHPGHRSSAPNTRTLHPRCVPL